MDPTHFMSIPATVLHRQVAGHDEYNDEIYEIVEIPATCWIEMASSTDFDNAQQTEAQWVLWMPPEIPVVATDKVRVSGSVMEVLGNPDKPIHPRTGQVLLTRIAAKEVT